MEPSQLIYYSIYCPVFEQDSYLSSDVLMQVRQKYFETGKKQKNKITKKDYEKTYHYAYDLAPNKPMTWKKMCDGKILEKNIPSKDGYAITSQNETTTKITYFSNEHKWLRTQYLTNAGQKMILFSVEYINENNLMFKELDKKTKEYKIFTASAMDLRDTNGFLPIAPKAICYTSKGELFFFSEEQVKSYKNIMQKLKEKKLTDTDALPTSSENEVKSEISLKDTKSNQSHYLYSGQTLDNLRHGFGRTYTSDHRTIYEGEYKDDKRDGLGVLYTDKGELSYVGNFSQNKKNGLGVTFSADKNLMRVDAWQDNVSMSITTLFGKKGNLIYHGNTDQNKRNGLGITHSIDGTKLLAGKWVDGKFAGEGVIFSMNGNIEHNGRLSSEQLEKFNLT